MLRRHTNPAHPALTPTPSPDLEPRTQQIARDLLTATRAHPTKKLWSNHLMSWALQNHDFKIQLFRFIDVFPVLKSPDAIHQHLLEYLQQPNIQLPPGMSLTLKAGGLLKGTLAHTITSQIQSRAQTFIAGDSLSAALPALHSQWQNNIAFSVDLLGEAVVSHAEAAIYQQRYLDLITQLPAATHSWPASPQLESDHLGPIPRTNVSIKISALDGHVSPVAADDSLQRLVTALAPLLAAAQKHNVLINFDMEHHALKELTIRLFKTCCEQFQFPAGFALQAYLQSADEDARDLLAWSKEKNRAITLRLIKGAYWDFETIHAEMMNWPAPVWPTKPETDACFERLTHLLLQHTPRSQNEPGIKLALGTHNIRSIAHALACLEKHHLPSNALEFQSLRGMADDLKSVLAQRGHRCREYVPIGNMIPGMAYLVRRLLENTSNESWLRADHAAHTPDDQLLAPPTGAATGATGMATTSVAIPVPHVPSQTHCPLSPPITKDFINEPWRDFSQQSARTSFQDALARTTVPNIQNNTTLDQMNHAITTAQNAFPAWRNLPQSNRSAILQKTATLMRRNRDPLAALICKESQKTWPEADADICEAIDFCNYYALQALHLLTPQPLSHLTGESNPALHTPRGPTAVIAPWNFPHANATGMTVAALVTGNPVLLKPAEQTPAIARALCQLLWEAGIPKDILHFLPGKGELIGAALVRHPKSPPSPSPAPNPSASTSSKPPPRQAPPSPSSNASSAKWAAKTPSSSTTPPTPTTPSSPSDTPPSPTPAKNAPPAPASSSWTTSTTHSSQDS